MPQINRFRPATSAAIKLLKFAVLQGKKIRDSLTGAGTLRRAMVQPMMNDTLIEPAENPLSDATEDFGFQKVRAGEKKPLVRGVFESVAQRYDLMNDLMSAGIHRLWKRELAFRLDPRPGQQILDVAGGTGDIAFRLLQNSRRGESDEQAKVIVCDITQSMLSVGRDRAIDGGMSGQVEWICGDAENLPFPSSSMDAYTIAFGLRNVTDIAAALREARRVLKPGGRYFCLEFSKLVRPLLERPYDFYSFEILPRMGKLVANDADSYRYLAESIRRFPDQDSLVELMRQAGLEQVSYRNLSGGIAALHSGWRI